MLSESAINKLSDCVADISFDCILAPYTSFKTGGKADALVVVSDSEELLQILSVCGNSGLSYRVFGKGTNLIVSDTGYAGIIIILGDGFKTIEVVEEADDSVLISVGAGASLTALCKFCMKHGYSGTEFSFGIPGTVGGAVIMNAGAWGGEISDIIESVTLIDKGKKVTALQESLSFSYRLWQDYEKKYAGSVVVGALLKCSKKDPAEVEKECQVIMNKRKKAQPITLPNAGSFFKNPIGVSAGQLIDECCLKGMRIGDVMVSEAHANFFVNLGNASSKDVRKLMEHVKSKVYEKHSVELQPEVHFI